MSSAIELFPSQRIAAHWNEALKKNTAGTRRLLWHDFPFPLRWLHSKVCGEPIDGPGTAGLNHVFKKRLDGRMLK